MNRLTEYHAGVAVIKNKSLHKEAMTKLARLEDQVYLQEKICDAYCKWPEKCADQVELDEKCEMCEIVKLFQ